MCLLKKQKASTRDKGENSIISVQEVK